MMKTFGITPEQYDQMLDSQGGRCAICGTDSHGHNKGQWPIDHDHETGVVRGLLCHNCNVMLGQAKDNTDTLRKAIEYLERHQPPID